MIRHLTGFLLLLGLLSSAALNAAKLPAIHVGENSCGTDLMGDAMAPHAPIDGELLVDSEPLPVETHQRPIDEDQRQVSFQKLANSLQQQANAHDGKIWVNLRRVKQIELTDAAFKILRKFHDNAVVGTPKDRSRRVRIQADLDFDATQISKDPRNKSKNIKVHMFKKKVSDELNIVAALIEEQTAKGVRLDRLVVRLVSRTKSEVAQIELPFMYNFFVRYQKYKGKMILVDEGIESTFNAELAVTSGRAAGAAAGLQTKIRSSFSNPNPLSALQLSIWIGRE